MLFRKKKDIQYDKPKEKMEPPVRSKGRSNEREVPSREESNPPIGNRSFGSERPAREDRKPPVWNDSNPFVSEDSRIVISLDNASKPPKLFIDGKQYLVVSINYHFETLDANTEGKHEIEVEYANPKEGKPYVEKIWFKRL